MMKLLIGITLIASTALAADICGASGYDKGTPASYLTDATANTPSLCASVCAKDATCKSFAVGAGVCNLYAAVVASTLAADNTGIATPTRSPYYFYDIGCNITSTSPPGTYSKAGPVCGIQGYDRGAPTPFTGDWVDQQPETCAAACKATTGCQAFALADNWFTHRATMCWFYTSLVNNFDANSLQNPAGSNFYFYEMSCFPNIVASASASSLPSASSAPSSANAVSVAASTLLTKTVMPSAVQSAAVTSIVATPAASLTCGAAGYDKGSPAAYHGASGATLDTCKSSCLSDATCKGFVIGTDGNCLLYASNFAQNFDASSGSIYKFYDVACFSGAGSTSLAPSTVNVEAATSTQVSSVAAPSSTKLCSLKGYEVSDADTSIVGFKFKPTAGCKSYCQGKSAVSYEQYYDYCICFSKGVSSIASTNNTSPVVFNDIAC